MTADWAERATAVPPPGSVPFKADDRPQRGARVRGGDRVRGRRRARHVCALDGSGRIVLLRVRGRERVAVDGDLVQRALEEDGGHAVEADLEARGRATDVAGERL